MQVCRVLLHFALIVSLKLTNGQGDITLYNLFVFKEKILTIFHFLIPSNFFLFACRNVAYAEFVQTIYIFFQL